MFVYFLNESLLFLPSVWILENVIVFVVSWQGDRWNWNRAFCRVNSWKYFLSCLMNLLEWECIRRIEFMRWYSSAGSKSNSKCASWRFRFGSEFFNDWAGSGGGAGWGLKENVEETLFYTIHSNLYHSESDFKRSSSLEDKSVAINLAVNMI